MTMTPPKKTRARQIYLICPRGGEAFAVTSGAEEVTRFPGLPIRRRSISRPAIPGAKSRKTNTESNGKTWCSIAPRSVATLYSLWIFLTLLRPHAAAPATKKEKAEKQSDVTRGTRAIATIPLRVDELLTSPDGSKLAFMANPINQREEKFDDYEIYVVDRRMWRGRPRPRMPNQSAARSIA